MAYRPAIAFALATGRGTRRRRRGRRRTYALGAVGPGAVDGRGGDVDLVDDGTGRPAFAPAVAGRLAVARGVRRDGDAEREEGGGGEVPFADTLKAPVVGLSCPT